MGVCGSKKSVAEVSEDEATVSRKVVLAAGVDRMSHASQEDAQALFRKYRYRQSSTQLGEDSPTLLHEESSRTASRERMLKKDLRRLLFDVDDELFEFVWGLFDANKMGVVYADDFVAAMALLTTASKGASFDEQVKACFALFDTRDDGCLTYSEFRSMLEATVTLNLKRMLLTDAGLSHVERHMEKEFSKENLTFWQAARAYRTAADRHVAASSIIERYIRADSEEEVNLPGAIKEVVLQQFASSAASHPPSEVLLEAAEEEIFKLMERDAYARFKSDPDAVGAVVDDFFAKADLSQDGTISYTEYHRWVMQQPEVIVFFAQLSESIAAIMRNATLQLRSSSASSNPGDVALELPAHVTEASSAPRAASASAPATAAPAPAPSAPSAGSAAPAGAVPAAVPPPAAVSSASALSIAMTDRASAGTEPSPGASCRSTSARSDGGKPESEAVPPASGGPSSGASPRGEAPAAPAAPAAF